MKTWLIKEISKLTNISTRMLRHYDEIGLLVPSIRQDNGYRCYTESDFRKLQQIIALRYFDFSLKQIKDILQKHTNIYAHLQAQHQFVKKQKQHLQNVDDLLGKILKGSSSSMTPNWQDLLLLIEGYQMNEQLREKLKSSWAGENLTAAQFEDYLFLYEQFPEEFAERDKMIEAINQNKMGEPDGEDGERVAHFMFELSRKMKPFFAKHSKLGSSLLKSMKSGKLTEMELSDEGTQWMSIAMLAHIRKQWDALYVAIKENMDKPASGKEGKQMAQQWRGLIDSQLESGNRDYMIGLLLWLDVARQEHEAKEMKTPVSPKDRIKPWFMEILFDPQATAWINEALALHPSGASSS